MNDPADFNDKEQTLPEAPASATVRVWIDDYGAMITTRATSMSKVMEQLEYIVGYAKKKEWQPKWSEDTPVKKEPVSKDECDRDHKTLKVFEVKKEGPNQGKQFRSCKKCNYFAWI